MSTDPLTHPTSALMVQWNNRRPTHRIVLLTLFLLIGLLLAPVGVLAQSPAEPAAASTAGEDIAYEPIAEELRALAEYEPTGEPDLPDDAREPAESGARDGIERATDSGVELTPEQEDAAVAGAVHAAAQYPDAESEQLYAAGYGGSYGALVQAQTVEITQLQAATYGGATGALSQSQSAEITQVQNAAFGAAHGSLAQHQHADVRQIQAAAIGGAAGAVNGAVQSQTVSVTQIQEAAQGGAYGALTQRQDVTIEQQQAAAFGAAGGATHQPAADPKKVQETSMASATGAVVGSQEATVTQIQAAARGACIGMLSQYQAVTITQIQTQTQQAAAETVRLAVEINIDQSVTIINYARGIAEQPDPPAADQPDGEQPDADADPPDTDRPDDSLVGLFVTVEETSVSLANPNNESVTVTITSETGDDDRQVDVPAGESITESLPPGEYTLTAETDDGRLVELSGEESLSITISEGAQDPLDLTVTVEDTTITIENPGEEPVDVIAANGDERSLTVPAREAVSETFEPGVWTLSGATAGEVTLNGEPELTVEIDDRQPELIELEATVDGQTVSLTNPSDTAVTVSAAAAGTEDHTIELPAGETVSEEFEPGNYSLSGEADAEQEVLINGEETYELTVEGEAEGEALETLTLTVDGQAVTIENPNDEPVSVSGTSDSENLEENQVFISVGPGESVTEQFQPGEYTLRAVVRFEDGIDPEDIRPVQLNGEDQLVFSIDGDELDGSVTGTVTDSASGDRIFGATVSIQETDLSVTTDEDGRYMFPDVPPGSPTVVVEADGYVSASDTVEVSPLETTQFDVELEPDESELPEEDPDDPDDNGEENGDGEDDNGDENGDTGDDDSIDNGDDGDDNGDSNGNDDDGNDGDTGDNDSGDNSENGEEDGNGNDENGDDDSTE